MLCPSRVRARCDKHWLFQRACNFSERSQWRGKGSATATFRKLRLSTLLMSEMLLLARETCTPYRGQMYALLASAEMTLAGLNVWYCERLNTFQRGRCPSRSLYALILPEFCPTADDERAQERMEHHSEIAQVLATNTKCATWKKRGLDSKSAGA
jgi:hypothetical protein